MKYSFYSSKRQIRKATNVKKTDTHVALNCHKTKQYYWRPLTSKETTT